MKLSGDKGKNMFFKDLFRHESLKSYHLFAALSSVQEPPFLSDIVVGTVD